MKTNLVLVSLDTPLRPLLSSRLSLSRQSPPVHSSAQNRGNTRVTYASFHMPHMPWSGAWGRGFNAAVGVAMRRRLPRGGGSGRGERDAGGASIKRARANDFSARSTPEGCRGGGGGVGSGAGAGGGAGGKDRAPRRGHVGGALGRTLASYNALNDAHPTATKVGTSVVILVFGDVAAQKMQHAAAGDGDDYARPPFALDWRRLGAFASFGAVYTGWFQMHWFRKLQSWFPKPGGGGGGGASFFSKSVCGPLLLNQFAMIPVAYYPFYFGWTGFVRGFTPEQTMQAMREKYKPRLLMQNWAFWLPAQGVQFSLVPPSYHILYVSAVGLVWNTILSLSTLGGEKGGRPRDETRVSVDRKRT